MPPAGHFAAFKYTLTSWLFMNLSIIGQITESQVSLFKKSQNALFVEEEIYNWASPKSRLNRNLIFLALIFVVGGLLFSLLRTV